MAEEEKEEVKPPLNKKRTPKPAATLTHLAN